MYHDGAEQQEKREERVGTGAVARQKVGRALRVGERACTYRMPRHTPRRRTGGASDVTLVAREVTTAGALIARLPRETVRSIDDPSIIDCAPPHVPTAGLATPSFVPAIAAQQGTALPQLAVQKDGPHRQHVDEIRLPGFRGPRGSPTPRRLRNPNTVARGQQASRHREMHSWSELDAQRQL